MSEVTRVNIKDYYRKSAGFMSFMNLLFVTAITCISFYMAEGFTSIVAGSVEAGNNVMGIYSLLAIVGVCLLIFLAVVSIGGMKGSRDENFKRQRLGAVFTIIAGVLYVINTLLVFGTEGYRVPDSTDFAVLIIGIGVSVAACIYTVFIISMTSEALKYSDIGLEDMKAKNRRKRAKKVRIANPSNKNKKGFLARFNRTKKIPVASNNVQDFKVADISAGLTQTTLNRRRTAVILSGFSVLMACVWLLCFYFEREIIAFDAFFAEDNSLDSMIFKVIYIVGFVAVADVMVSMYTLLMGKNASYAMTKQSIIFSMVIMLIFVVFSIIKLGSAYVQTGYPALEYIIFAYVLVVLAASIGVFIHIHMNKKQA